jgi:hypothetical protein
VKKGENKKFVGFSSLAEISTEISGFEHGAEILSYFRSPPSPPKILEKCAPYATRCALSDART